MFQTHCKYSKHIVNVSTALYLQGVTNSRKKIIWGKYQPTYDITHKKNAWGFTNICYNGQLLGGVVMFGNIFQSPQVGKANLTHIRALCLVHVQASTNARGKHKITWWSRQVQTTIIYIVPFLLKITPNHQYTTYCYRNFPKRKITYSWVIFDGKGQYI